MPKIKLLVDGGKMSPGPAVAQQLGPMGINLGKVISDINEATNISMKNIVKVKPQVWLLGKTYMAEMINPTMLVII